MKNSVKNKKLIFLILTFIWTAVIFSFSLQPGEVSGDLSGSLIKEILALLMPSVLEKPEQLEQLHWILRKCAHFTEFMILGMLARITLRYMELKYKGALGLAFCILVAMADEVIQLFVSDRAGRVQDVLIDSVGALVGILIVFMCLKFKGKNRMITNQQ